MCLYRRMSLGEETAIGEPLTAWAVTGIRVAHHLPQGVGTVKSSELVETRDRVYSPATGS